MSIAKENPKIQRCDAEVLALASELNSIALKDDEEARGMAEIEGRNKASWNHLFISQNVENWTADKRRNN